MRRAMTKQQLEDKCFMEPNTGCWLWPGLAPYGPVKRSLRLFKGIIHPGGVNNHIRHSCDTPACINPDHLTLGTRGENMDDMFRRGRAATHISSQRKQKTHCKSGHEFTPENIMIEIDGKWRKRKCRACKAISCAKYLAKLKSGEEPATGSM